MTGLLAPEPGWQAEADTIVIGSGVAGLTTALHARLTGRRVLLVTKGRVEEGSTQWAQGGIAAALADDDSPRDHLHDTLVAGAGLCDVDAVRTLVTEGPQAVWDLIEVGAAFDRDASGALSLTREGGHLRSRIAHAGGDATGAEISRALVAAVALDPGIELIEGALALDLLRDDEGSAQGVTLHVMGQGQRDGVGAALAPSVILAAGGFGQVFAQTTNPPVATGDGAALGLRAGAEVADMEFVQFHPTVLWLGPRARGQQPLVSEAVRGEGALLVDGAGERFMLDVHPLAELAPRDIVSRATLRRMHETGAAHVWLDARAFGARLWEERFPTILASCRSHGIDPVTELIPVSPASHYVSGGIRTDLDGRSSIPGLFACGEAACTGVHGANRLASNSLLEGLVFAARIGRVLAGESPVRRTPVPPTARGALVSHGQMRALQHAMSVDASVIRSADSLARAADVLADIARAPGATPCTDDWEMTNLHLVARTLVHHARIREETRGSHWREDFPERDDDRWRVRLVTSMTRSGDLVTRHETVTPASPTEGDDRDH
ncbi:MAG: L-aspartate oxidase [bacterium]